MNGIKVIYMRELRGYFYTPIGYLFLITSLLFNFYFFFAGLADIVPPFFSKGVASVRGYMNMLPLSFLLLVPAITMRIWSEEIHSGTLEFLFSLPLSIEQIVVGKFFAAWSVVSLLILASLPLTVNVWLIGDLDVGLTCALYAGSILMAGGYVSMGMMLSSITGEQVVSFLLIFFSSLFMFLSNFYIITRELPSWIAGTLSFFSLSYHQSSFNLGVIDFADTLYYISFTALMGTVNVWILRSKR